MYTTVWPPYFVILYLASLPYSRYPWIPWNLSFRYILFREETNLLILAGSAFYQIWLGCLDRRIAYCFDLAFVISEFHFHNFHMWAPEGPSVADCKFQTVLKAIIIQHNIQLLSLFWSLQSSIVTLQHCSASFFGDKHQDIMRMWLPFELL